MRTLPITAGKEEIRELVIEWNELLAQEKYREAMEMFMLAEDNECCKKSIFKPTIGRM